VMERNVSRRFDFCHDQLATVIERQK
jgi:hypothetical protein